MLSALDNTVKSIIMIIVSLFNPSTDLLKDVENNIQKLNAEARQGEFHTIEFFGKYFIGKSSKIEDVSFPNLTTEQKKHGNLYAEGKENCLKLLTQDDNRFHLWKLTDIDHGMPLLGVDSSIEVKYIVCITFN